jgi:hypothetical protein
VIELTYERLLVPMSDMPGLVHGIVSIDPPMVQCDGCGLVATGPAGRGGLTVILADITFDSSDDFTARLCADCRKAKGIAA